MKFVNNISLLISVSAFSLLVNILPCQAEEWSLDKCIGYALDHNIQIKIKEQDINTAGLQIEDSKHSFLPQIGASASQSFNFGRGLTSENTYANRNTSNFQVGAQVSVPIFSGLKNARTLELSKLNLRQITWQLEQTRDNVTLNVISQYLQALYSKEVMVTSANQVELSKLELERRRALLQSGRIAEVEVIEAEALLASDNLTLVNAKNDFALGLLELTQLLQLDSTDNFDVLPLENDEPLIPDVQTVFNSALNINSSIKAAESSIEVARANISVAQTGYIPTLSFNGGVGSSYYKLNGINNLSFSKQMRENYSTYIGFSLNIPIFDALNTRTSVKRARVNLLSAQLQADLAKSDLYKAVQQAHIQASGAYDKYKTAIVSCNAAQAAYDAMSQKYNIGRATSTEYEQSKNKLFSAQIQQLQAHYEYILRYKILEYYRLGNQFY